MQMKMIKLIQQADKKENSSSKIYEMSKWSFDNAIPVNDWNTVHCATMHFIGIKTPDNAQINDELYTFSNT